VRLDNVHAGFGKSGIEGIETVLSSHEQLLLLRRLAPLSSSLFLSGISISICCFPYIDNTFVYLTIRIRPCCGGDQW
jgi:hypothetical protein